MTRNVHTKFVSDTNTNFVSNRNTVRSRKTGPIKALALAGKRIDSGVQDRGKDGGSSGPRREVRRQPITLRAAEGRMIGRGC